MKTFLDPRSRAGAGACRTWPTLKIRLNGETAELPGPLTIAALLAHLEIDARRVAVEHNLSVVRRAAYETTTVNEGDEIEIVNFVGGGAAARVPSIEPRVPS